MSESSLVVRGVRLQDAGSYQCTASNLFGRDVESLSLTITGIFCGCHPKEISPYAYASFTKISVNKMFNSLNKPCCLTS